MKIPEWVKFDTPTPEYRTWSANNEKIQASMVDFIFRCTEMTLVIGVVRYLEVTLSAPQITSLLLIGCLSLFVRTKLSSALFLSVENFNLSEKGRRILYWAFWCLVWIPFFLCNWLVTEIVPVLSENQ
tara:strand:+ start:10375 stop:10758 length:384 start_codon:yes stop_codon:yes gene_type:complete